MLFSLTFVVHAALSPFTPISEKAARCCASSGMSACERFGKAVKMAERIVDVMLSASLDDENSIDNPNNVVPLCREQHYETGEKIVVPGHSVVVIRI